MIFEDFMIYAMVAGIGIALAAGPLGCFVVWRRMAYFGDATSHAAILGVALALALDAPVFVGVLITAIAMAVLVSASRSSSLAMDTLLGVAAHASLAVGLVAVALTPGRRINLEVYLFGDILSIGPYDLAVIWLAVFVVFAVLVRRWDTMLTATLNRDLASAEGMKPDREQLILALMLACLVAVALKVVGALLITAMLIIPAATARSLAQTPERMALYASAIGCAAVLLGLQLSAQFDTPAGPSIVVVSAFGFILVRTVQAIRQ